MCNICYFQSNYFSMFIYCAFIPLFIHCHISFCEQSYARTHPAESVRWLDKNSTKKSGRERERVLFNVAKLSERRRIQKWHKRCYILATATRKTDSIKTQIKIDSHQKQQPKNKASNFHSSCQISRVKSQ